VPRRTVLLPNQLVKFKSAGAAHLDVWRLAALVIVGAAAGI